MIIKPQALQKGDCVATVSTSFGGAGDPDMRWRYDQGVQRLEEVFGLHVVPMPHSLKGSSYLYEHPEKRAEDLMTAFKDPTIKGIITNIGGEESIRLLPYIDFDVIRENPKIVTGYSDTTITHLCCWKAGLSSFYGLSLLVDLAENVAIDPYTIDMVERLMFQTKPIGEILPPTEWTSEFLPWEISNKYTRRQMQPNHPYELLSGSGVVEGHLLGGCMAVLEFAKSTSIWPKEEDWEGCILFFETSEDKPTPKEVTYWLRNYGAQGILHKARGMLFAKPADETYYEEYKTCISTVLREYGIENMPVLYNVSIGHTEPKAIIPYGAKARIDCEKVALSIDDCAVVDSV
ncbi:MAG TPA: S66 peptidase family protein [Bacillota bacterium]|nr:S66 peptidase family protein [Bacillota bacterium]